MMLFGNKSITIFMSSTKKIILTILLLLPVSLAAQPSFSGFLELDKRFVTGGDSTYIDNFYNEFRLEASSYIGSQLYLFSSIDIRFYDFPTTRTLNDLEERGETFPVDYNLWEAYLDVYGFLFDKLDLRIGKQRINWGTADELNPTDNLNPNDFSNLIEFTDKLPSWAIKGTWYFGESQLTGIWLPSLSPVLLPREGASLFLGQEMAGLPNRLRLPDQTPVNSMVAVKFSGLLLEKWDYSLSYFSGYDDFPILSRMELNPNTTRPQSFDMAFPRMQVFGADLAGELSGIGLWAEAALVLPDKITTTTLIGGASTTTTALDDEAYVKFTAGGDYTFPGGWYVNGQWVHGFDTERGSGQLNDYLFVRLEQTFWRDDLKAEAGAALEVADWGRLSDRYGFGLFPAITYQAIDNLKVKTGAFLIYGKPSTMFGSWKTLDQVFVRFRVDF
jgi:hypothetical protein